MKTLAIDIYEESRLTYDALGEQYAEKDKFRGDDFDVIDEIISKIKKKNIKVLDLGCGSGHFIEYILKNNNERAVEVVGVDFSKNMIKSAGKKVDALLEGTTLLVCMDIDDYLSSHSDKFDLIIMTNNVLGNIFPRKNEGQSNYRVQTLEKIKDKLMPDGFIFISVYNAESLQIMDNAYKEDTWKIHGKLNDNDLIIALLLANKEYHYYTHWFTEDELLDIHRIAGLSKYYYMTRNTRLLLISEKMG